ncbi:MAG TPA: adenylate/guanylate cyclase domain-containing protein [Puia sp.]|jgi:TolB-like protein/class 3 adenylate cyclase/Tfp pilus assembly protein PilF
MSQHRQLSAIMFTDIEGYTAIMQKSEQNAVAIRNRHREIIQKEHEQFNGRIIQFYGDGTLSTFTSIVEAVQCALSMQQKFLQKPKVPVRMGLHIGDIIFNEEHIFGDGVNLTSRVESLGVAGSILISDKANEELHNHPELKTISVGTYQFKNINRLVEVFALNHEELVKPTPQSLSGKTEEKKEQESSAKPAKAKDIPFKSIAVLPFVNMSNDAEQEYFSDGIAEEIINSLTHLKDLRVAGRTSSFQFKGKNIELHELGEKLNVRTVLAGSVRKQGNWLRITAQLVNVEDGYHLWSEKYDRKMDDVFAIQDDIAMAITKKLKLTLLKNDRALMTKSYTQNTEAYELYLKGRFYMTRRGASILTALQYFEKAIELDPEFALAHNGYADVNLIIAVYSISAPKQAMARAKQSAEKALKLDPSLCEPYCTLGYYYTCYERNWPVAKKNFLKSIEVNPRFAEGHVRYGWNYLATVEGQFDEAEKQGEMAIRLEPLSAYCHASYALILHCAGKFKEALAICKIGIELDAHSFLCYATAGCIHMALGQYDEAISCFEISLTLSNRHSFTVHPFIWIYCITGGFDKARSLMNELKERSKSEYLSYVLTALSAAYLKDLDAAFDYLEKAFEDRDPSLILLKYEPWVPEELKADPRFQKILDRIGFPISASSV